MALRQAAIYLFAALLAAWGGTSVVFADEVPAATITIYNTGDLHDHTQTLAKIAGFVKREKQKDPNVLFVDAGDLMNKGENQMAATQGEGMFRLMELAGYDACVLGNHDYIYGKDRILELSLRHPRFPLVLCNMKWSDADREKTKNIARYRVFELQGVRVAVSGGGSHYLNHAHGPPMPVFSEREGYAAVLPEIKGKADVFVFVSHLYNGSDQGFLAGLKDDAPDVLIGGHTHEQKTWNSGKTLIVKAGAVGTCLGQTTIKWDPAQKKILSKSARILRIGGDWPEDAAVKAAREQYHKPAPKAEKKAA